MADTESKQVMDAMAARTAPALKTIFEELAAEFDLSAQQKQAAFALAQGLSIAVAQVRAGLKRIPEMQMTPDEWLRAAQVGSRFHSKGVDLLAAEMRKVDAA